jgi:hypothetical protein
MRGIEYSQLGREVDQLGDVFLTYHNRSKRHNGVVGVLARAARQALNAKVQTEQGVWITVDTLLTHCVLTPFPGAVDTS